MASKNTKAVKNVNSKIAKAAKKTAPVKPAARSDAELAAAKATTEWAIGAAVEHPAHGKGKVVSHTPTVGIVQVEFDNAAHSHTEVHTDELVLVADKPLHAPHTKKEFNFPTRKAAKKHAKKHDAMLGTAQEQNRGYAKLAAKLAQGARVVCLSDKREGYVAERAAQGSGFIDVLFDLDGKPATKHVSGLKELKLSKKDKLWKLGDMVITKPDAGMEISGEVAALSFTKQEARVRIGGAAISGWLPFASLQPYASEASKPVKAPVETTRFENLPLLSGFRLTKDDKDRTLVKVGNTSALIVPVLEETNGGAGAHLPYVHLTTLQNVDVQIDKIRLKKNVQVKPIEARPFEHGAAAK